MNYQYNIHLDPSCLVTVRITVKIRIRLKIRIRFKIEVKFKMRVRVNRDRGRVVFKNLREVPPFSTEAGDGRISSPL